MVQRVRAGRSPEDLAREFEPSSQTIRNWVQQAELDRLEGDLRGRSAAGLLRRASERGDGLPWSPPRPKATLVAQDESVVCLTQGWTGKVPGRAQLGEEANDVLCTREGPHGSARASSDPGDLGRCPPQNAGEAKPYALLRGRSSRRRARGRSVVSRRRVGCRRRRGRELDPVPGWCSGCGHWATQSLRGCEGRSGAVRKEPAPNPDRAAVCGAGGRSVVLNFWRDAECRQRS